MNSALIKRVLAGDRVLANKIIYDTCDPQRGDLVVFISP